MHRHIFGLCPRVRVFVYNGPSHSLYEFKSNIKSMGTAVCGAARKITKSIQQIFEFFVNFAVVDLIASNEIRPI